jgi:hypothetical protein
MKITHISAQGLKGRNIEQKLEPVCLLHGDWASGKTAITDAIRLGLLGYLPELGKRSVDTFKLASTDKMAVELEFDGRDKIKRSWTGKGGKVTSDKALPAWLKDDNFPPGIFDCREFFGLTARERQQVLFDRVASATPFNVTVLVDKLRFIARNPEQDKVVKTLIADVVTSDTQRQNHKIPLPEWFTAQVELLRSKELATNSNVKTLRNGLQAQAQVEATGNGAPIVVPDIGKIRTQLEATIRQAERTSEVIKNEESNRKARAEANAILAKFAEFNGETESLESWRIRVGELTAKVEAYPKDNNISSELSKAQQAKERWASSVGHNQEEVDRLTSELKLATTGDCCPECGSKNRNWATRREAKYRPRLDDAILELARVKEGLRVASVDIEAKEKLAQVCANAQAKKEKDQSLLTEAKEIVQRLESEKSLRKLAEKTLANLPEPEDIEARTLELATLQNAITQLRFNITNAEALQRQDIARRAGAAQREKTKAMLVEQETASAVYKAAGKVVQEVQADIIQNTVGAFMEKAGGIISDVMGRKLEFKDGEIGYHIGEHWVSHETFCGSEKLLAYMGFQLALAAEAPVRIIIIAEMGDLPPKGKRLLIETANRLVTERKLDNFIGCDPQAVDYVAHFMTDELQLIECKG